MPFERVFFAKLHGEKCGCKITWNLFFFVSFNLEAKLIFQNTNFEKFFFNSVNLGKNLPDG